MTETFGAGKDVWNAIWKASKTHKTGPRYAAVAFVTQSDLLSHFGKGDLVVCNAGPNALYAGATNPDALAALLRRKVRVVSVDNLHAKVFLFDQTVIVGSANASVHATGQQVEAATQSTNAKVRSDAKTFIESQAKRGFDVDAAFIAQARRVFLPPRRSPWTTSAHRGSTSAPTHRVFVWEFAVAAPPKAVVATAKQSRPTKTVVGPATSFGLDYMWQKQTDLRPGDYVIGVEGDLVYPPEICILIRPAHASPWTVVWCKYPKDVWAIPWHQLRGHVLATTGRTISLNRGVRNVQVRAAVFDAFGLGGPDGTQDPF